MYLIQEVLVSEEVFSRQFVCHIDKCKGACCWEGDYGAPIAEDEIDQIKAAYPIVKKHLSDEAINQIDHQGTAPYDKEYGGKVTPLMDDSSCAFLLKDDFGAAVCSFQKAYQAGETDFVKPISCQLYPLRVTSNKDSGFEALNYDEWDICSAACKLGKELSMPVFRFVKDAIIRKYGAPFYAEMEQIYEDRYGGVK